MDYIQDKGIEVFGYAVNEYLVLSTNKENEVFYKTHSAQFPTSFEQLTRNTRWTTYFQVFLDAGFKHKEIYNYIRTEVLPKQKDSKALENVYMKQNGFSTK